MMECARAGAPTPHRSLSEVAWATALLPTTPSLVSKRIQNLPQLPGHWLTEE